jgi:hypothetical protein
MVKKSLVQRTFLFNTLEITFPWTDTQTNKQQCREWQKILHYVVLFVKEFLFVQRNSSSQIKRKSDCMKTEIDKKKCIKRKPFQRSLQNYVPE